MWQWQDTLPKITHKGPGAENLFVRMGVAYFKRLILGLTAKAEENECEAKRIRFEGFLKLLEEHKDELYVIEDKVFSVLR